MPRRPRLDEPVIVSRDWLNRQHDALVVTLSTFNDINIIDVRKHSMSRGKLVPTPKATARTLALRTPVQSNQQRFGNVSRLTPKLLTATPQPGPPALTIVSGGRKRGGKYG
jgi:hypothetical protein